MNDRSVGPAEFHANEVQPRTMTKQDMAGGSEIGGAEVEDTNAKPFTTLEKEEHVIDSASQLSFEGDEPTEQERKTLRKVADSLPWAAFLVAMIELCERFTYYGLSGPFQKYVHSTKIRFIRYPLASFCDTAEPVQIVEYNINEVVTSS